MIRINVGLHTENTLILWPQVSYPQGMWYLAVWVFVLGFATCISTWLNLNLFNKIRISGTKFIDWPAFLMDQVKVWSNTSWLRILLSNVPLHELVNVTILLIWLKWYRNKCPKLFITLNLSKIKTDIFRKERAVFNPKWCN